MFKHIIEALSKPHFLRAETYELKSLCSGRIFPSHLVTRLSSGYQTVHNVLEYLCMHVNMSWPGISVHLSTFKWSKPALFPKEFSLRLRLQEANYAAGVKGR